MSFVVFAIIVMGRRVYEMPCSLHRGGHAERLVNSAKVVPREVSATAAGLASGALVM